MNKKNLSKYQSHSLGWAFYDTVSIVDFFFTIIKHDKDLSIICMCVKLQTDQTTEWY